MRTREGKFSRERLLEKGVRLSCCPCRDLAPPRQSTAARAREASRAFGRTGSDGT